MTTIDCEVTARNTKLSGNVFFESETESVGACVESKEETSGNLN